MDNFIYSIPTVAYFGKGQINILGKTIKTHGGTKVLLAYGGGSIKQYGIYDVITSYSIHYTKLYEPWPPSGGAS